MTTHKISSPLMLRSAHAHAPRLWAKYISFVDSQEPNALAWWLGSLLLQGCILVPLTFLLVYSLGGPVSQFLFISMVCFFINVIANMGGAAFRLTFNSLVLSIIIHLAMIITTVIITV